MTFKTEPISAREIEVNQQILFAGEVKTVSQRWFTASQDPKESERTMHLRFAEGGGTQGLEGQTLSRIIRGSEMTFEQYMKAVIAYFKRGGVTWEQAYWRSLEECRPDVARVIRANNLRPIDQPNELGGFLFVTFTNWGN